MIYIFEYSVLAIFIFEYIYKYDNISNLNKMVTLFGIFFNIEK